MLSLSKFFDHPGLVAFTSDASVDYTLDETVPFLTEGQRSALSQAMGTSFGSLAWVKQVHGADVIAVDQKFIDDPVLREADALVTDQKGILVAVRTADCLPVFIWDPVHEAMGVVHAGWKSTHQSIVRRVIKAMAVNFRSDVRDLRAAFGPAIRSCCYEVGPEFATNFPQAVVCKNGKMFMDLIGANRDQLVSSGIKEESIFDCRICTVCDPGYFSYRRDGAKTGRMISGMVLKG